MAASGPRNCSRCETLQLLVMMGSGCKLAQSRVATNSHALNCLLLQVIYNPDLVQPLLAAACLLGESPVCVETHCLCCLPTPLSLTMAAPKVTHPKLTHAVCSPPGCYNAAEPRQALEI